MSNIECVFFIENPENSHLPNYMKITPSLYNTKNVGMKSLTFWIEYKEKVRLDFYSTGFMLREIKSHLLIADLPNLSIDQVQQISNDIFKILFKNNKKIAIQICSQNCIDNFIKNILKCQLNFQKMNDFSSNCLNDTVNFPDLNNVTIQNFILNLLFSDKFQEFSNKFSSLFNEINGKLVGSNILNCSESEDDSVLDEEIEENEEVNKKKKTKLSLENNYRLVNKEEKLVLNLKNSKSIDNNLSTVNGISKKGRKRKYPERYK